MDTEIIYQEISRQEYTGNSCVFSAGFAEGHAIDTMYLRLERPDAEEVTLLLRPDEMAIISTLLTGVLWSWLVAHVEEGRPMATPP